MQNKELFFVKRDLESFLGEFFISQVQFMGQPIMYNLNSGAILPP